MKAAAYEFFGYQGIDILVVIVIVILVERIGIDVVDDDDVVL